MNTTITMKLRKLCKVTAAAALALATGSAAHAASLYSSPVWADDGHLVYCTIANQSATTATVDVYYVGEFGQNLKGPMQSVLSPGRTAFHFLTGPNQFASCRFDIKTRARNDFRANIHVPNPDGGPNIWFGEAR